MKNNFTRILCAACALWLAEVAAARAQSSVLVVNVNGETTVTFRGKEVFTGETKGPVRGESINTGRKTYAAAFEGKTLLWESEPGAAQEVKSALVAEASLERRARANGRALPPRVKRPTSNGLWVTTSTNRLTTVKWDGKEVFAGPTTGSVTAKGTTLEGMEWAAVFDGDRVLWENVKGAAKRLK